MNKEEFIARWAPGDILNGDLSYYDFKNDLELLLQETACRVKVEVEDGYRFLSQAMKRGKDSERKGFWLAAEGASREVKQWPKWKTASFNIEIERAKTNQKEKKG